MTKRFEANWRTREMLAIALAWRLGRLKLKAVPTADLGSAPLPGFIKSNKTIEIRKTGSSCVLCDHLTFDHAYIISFMLSVRGCTGDYKASWLAE